MFDAEDRSISASVWVALSRDAVTLSNLRAASGADDYWRRLRKSKEFDGWTDDYASILPLMKFEALVPLE